MADELDKTGTDFLPIDQDMVDPEQYKKEGSFQNIAYPRLEVVSGLHEGMVFALTPGEHLLGRVKESVAIFLDDTSVSRAHCQFLVKGDEIKITDLGSRNGTLVQGKKIKANQETVLLHLDQIRVGSYILRLAKHPVTEAELAAKVPPSQTTAKTPKPQMAEPQVAVPQVADDVLEMPDKAAKESVQALAVIPAEDISQEDIGVRLRTIFLILCALSTLAGLGYYTYSQYQKLKSEGVNNTETADTLVEVVPTVPEDPSVENPKAQEPKAQDLKVLTLDDPVKESPSGSYQAFLDIASKPMAARVFMADKLLGTTPLKVPVTLVPQKKYTIVAEFDLRDVGDVYQERLEFTADVRQEIVPLGFDAAIGMIKVLRLPRDVQFYLEGYYAYDKYRANPVKLTDIIYGRPIYVPYGHYVIELREQVRLGGSQTMVNDIRYRREFDLEASRRHVELKITDRDLQFFPAHLKSQPSHAMVYLNGEKIGETPFEGEIPLGNHALKLTHEGFFDYETPLEVRTNVPFEATYTLKTSKVGENINRAKNHFANAHYDEAIAELVDALQMGTQAAEKAEIHWLMGQSYFALGNYERALAYFAEAESSADFKIRAWVGMAETLHATHNRDDALKLLVKAMLNMPNDENLKREARTLFTKISPIMSVVYMTTEPTGATLFVNGVEVEQKTPALLPELNLGSYRFELQKPGYKSEQIRRDIKLGEFVPIIIKLTPEKL